MLTKAQVEFLADSCADTAENYLAKGEPFLAVALAESAKALAAARVLQDDKRTSRAELLTQEAFESLRKAKS